MNRKLFIGWLIMVVVTSLSEFVLWYNNLLEIDLFWILFPVLLPFAFAGTISLTILMIWLPIDAYEIYKENKNERRKSIL